MNLSVAFAGFIFLMFLVFSLYFAWGGFFSSAAQKKFPAQGALETSPEWRAFLHRRQEIENDPVLDEQGKKTLIENWQAMADESKPHMATTNPAIIQSLKWASPAMLPVLVAGTLLLASLFAYFAGAMHPGALQWPGKPAAIPGAALENQPGQSSATAGHPGDGASLEDRLAGLQGRLAEYPDDLRGWVLLARTHASMSNYPESVKALKKALELTPGHPDVLADLADMTAMAQGRQLTGEPKQYIAAALQSDPRHEKALALAASAAEQAGDPNKAQVYWQLLSQVQQANLKTPPSAPTSPSAPLANAPLITAKLDIPGAALNRMNENSALFVILKAQAGPGKPLAVVRVPATQLNAGVQNVPIGAGDFIEESAANNLPNTVYIQARLSIQGMAQPNPGDIQSAPVALDRSKLAAGASLSMPEGPAKP